MKKMTLWGIDENDETLIDEIIKKKKIITCSPKVWYYNDPEEEPTNVGDIVAVCNVKGIRRCIIEIVENYEITYGNVDIRIAEGEGFSNVEEFKKAHNFCWEDSLRKEGFTLDESTLIVVEHFKLISVE
jgi:uncharacterized protein YhfF